MKKWILICVGMVVIIIIVLIFGLKNLGPVIKNAINKYGPAITKTEVHIGDVSVSLFSGKAELRDFYLGNPEGFKSQQAMKVGSIRLDVDETSITSDTIIINTIEVVAPEINYEKASGTDNFKTILNNVKNSITSDNKASKGSSEEKRGKKILIKNFIVRDGEVSLIMPLEERVCPHRCLRYTLRIWERKKEVHHLQRPLTRYSRLCTRRLPHQPLLMPWTKV